MTISLSVYRLEIYRLVLSIRRRIGVENLAECVVTFGKSEENRKKLNLYLITSSSINLKITFEFHSTSTRFTLSITFAASSLCLSLLAAAAAAVLFLGTFINISNNRADAAYSEMMRKEFFLWWPRALKMRLLALTKYEKSQSPRLFLFF